MRSWAEGGAIYCTVRELWVPLDAESVAGVSDPYSKVEEIDTQTTYRNSKFNGGEETVD